MAANFKCATVGCYSYQSPETNTLFQTLQTRVNQFAAAAGIALLKQPVDGVIGKGTTEATLIVLLYLAEIDKGVVGSSAAALEAGISAPEQLAANAQAVVDVLTLAVKQSGTAQVAIAATPLPAPRAQPSTTQLATTSSNLPVSTTSAAAAQRQTQVKTAKPGLKRSVFDRVPPWAPYVGGIALVAGTIGILVAKNKRKGGGRSAPSLPSLSPAVVAGWGIARAARSWY